MDKNTVNKNDLCESIYQEMKNSPANNANAKISKPSVKITCELFLDQIVQFLKEGKIVSLLGFGKFSTRITPARVIQSVKNPEEQIHVPETKSIKFKPSNVIKREVNLDKN